RFVLHNNLGMLWFQQGEFKEAIQELKQVLEYGRDPDRWRTRDLLAEGYRGYKAVVNNDTRYPRLVDATGEATKAITLRPDQPDLYRRRALIFRERGMMKEAVKDLDTAVTLREQSKVNSDAQQIAKFTALLEDLTILGQTLLETGE